VTLLLCAFGAFFVVQFVKALLRVRLSPWQKLLGAAAAALGGAALVQHRDIHALVLLGVGAAGLAILIHRGARLLSLLGDWTIRLILLSRTKVR